MYIILSLVSFKRICPEGLYFRCKVTVWQCVCSLLCIIIAYCGVLCAVWFAHCVCSVHCAAVLITQSSWFKLCVISTTLLCSALPVRSVGGQMQSMHCGLNCKPLCSADWCGVSDPRPDAFTSRLYIIYDTNTNTKRIMDTNTNLNAHKYTNGVSGFEAAAHAHLNMNYV